MGKLRLRHRAATVLLCAAALCALLASVSRAAAPSATTKPATNISFDSATLNGTIDAMNTDEAWFFRYGTGTNYDHTSSVHAVTTPGTQDVSVQITGLQPLTTYHFQLVIEDPYPQPQYYGGGDLTFMTSSPPNTVATTGQATNVTMTGATLNGVVNTNSADTAWAFQYGETTAYGHHTNTHTVGIGVTAVSARITGLKPGTTYHYRLLVAQGSNPTYRAGEDRTFTTLTTPLFGTAVLASHRLKVKHKRVKIPFRCTGQSGAQCNGTARLSLKRNGQAIGCGKGKLAAFAPNKQSVSTSVRGRCAALLKASKHRRLKVTLRVTFTTNQATLKTTVTLVR